MSNTEFYESNFGDTLLFIEARRHLKQDQQDNEIYKMKIQRLNTFYLITATGAKVSSPEKLYNLKGDEDCGQNDIDDAFSEEANEAFKNFY